MKKKTLVYALCLVTLLFSSSAMGDGLSRDQGDVIISELRQIRQLLEKQQKGDTAPAAPAPPERVRLKIGKEFTLGRSDAPLVMVEYTDYQCAFCNQFYANTFPELKKQYIDTGKMRFISRDFPLEFHQNALKAAQATHCAGEQDKFWQMKDSLMINSARLTPDLINSIARDIPLDMSRYQTCMETGKYLTEIKNGIAAANSVGINGTPSFVIGTMNGDTLNGLRVVGAQPFSVFEKLIKEAQSGKGQK